MPEVSLKDFLKSWKMHMLMGAICTLPVCFTSAWWFPFAMTPMWWFPFGYVREAWQDLWTTPIWDFTWHKHREALAWSWGSLSTAVLSLSWAFL